LVWETDTRLPRSVAKEPVRSGDRDQVPEALDQLLDRLLYPFRFLLELCKRMADAPRQLSTSLEQFELVLQPPTANIISLVGPWA
jgi:hypothetical protein